MVTNFIALAATKGKRKGPWGLAQQRIARASSNALDSKPTKRAIGRRKRRRRGPKDCLPRQHRKVHKVRKAECLSTVKGKHLYVEWGEEYTEAGKVCNSFNLSSNQIVDVSNYRIIDVETNKKGHAVVVDDSDGCEPLFICAKIDTRQSRSSLNGRTGMNIVRDTLASFKNQSQTRAEGRKHQASTRVTN